MFYWCMDQTNVQRVLGARSVEDGQKGAIFAGFLKLLIPFILVLPGVIARILYPGCRNPTWLIRDWLDCCR